MNKLLLSCLLFSSVSVLAMQKSKEQELIEVAKQNEIERVRELIDEGACGTEINSSAMTAVHYLADHGHNDLIDLLISRGADINAVGHKGVTPLVTALMSDRGETVTFLLEKKADPQIKIKKGEDDTWMTPLGIASLMGKKEMIILLLQAGVSINSVLNSKGMTLLYTSAKKGHGDILELCLEKGADLDVRDNRGWNPLMVAVMAGQNEIVRLLLEKKADPNVKVKSGEDDMWVTPLGIASVRRMKDITTLLLQSGVSINSVLNSVGMTLLHISAKKGQGDIVKLCLERGADLDARDNRGWNPLMVAVLAGQNEIVRLLLENKADPNVKIMNDKDDGWMTPLGLASALEMKDITTLLLQSGASIDTILSSDSMTLLHVSAKEGQGDIVKLCLEKGADPDARDNEGCTPLMVAVQADQNNIVRLLLEKKADVNGSDNNGLNALHFAGRCGRGAIAELLLNRGADLNQGDKKKITPLHVAALHKQETVGALFMDHNQIKINAQALNGWTALHVAAYEGCLEITKRLLEKKADVSLLSEDQQTPLLLAQQAGHTAIARLLKARQGVEVRYCLGCGTTKKLKRCGGCQKVFFCGTDCQKSVWSIHKKVCRK